MRGLCKFHLKDEMLCKAHILPKAFYFRTGKDRDGFFLYKKGVKYSKRQQAGMYDKNILCASGDNHLGRFEGCAIDFFDWDVKGELYQDEKGRHIYKVEHFDFEMLQLFVLALIWKAHHSTLEPFRAFDIGSLFEQAIHKKLVHSDGSPERYFAFLISHFSVQDKHIPLKLPWRQKVGGYNVLFLYVLNYKIMAFLDSKGPPKWTWPFLVAPERPIYMSTEPYVGSTEYVNDMAFIDHLVAEGIR